MNSLLVCVDKTAQLYEAGWTLATDFCLIVQNEQCFNFQGSLLQVINGKEKKNLWLERHIIHFLNFLITKIAATIKTAYPPCISDCTDSKYMLHQSTLHMQKPFNGY